MGYGDGTGGAGQRAFEQLQRWGRGGWAWLEQGPQRRRGRRAGSAPAPASFTQRAPASSTATPASLYVAPGHPGSPSAGRRQRWSGQPALTGHGDAVHRRAADMGAGDHPDQAGRHRGHLSQGWPEDQAQGQALLVPLPRRELHGRQRQGGEPRTLQAAPACPGRPLSPVPGTTGAPADDADDQKKFKAFCEAKELIGGQGPRGGGNHRDGSACDIEYTGSPWVPIDGPGGGLTGSGTTRTTTGARRTSGEPCIQVCRRAGFFCTGTLPSRAPPTTWPAASTPSRSRTMRW